MAAPLPAPIAAPKSVPQAAVGSKATDKTTTIIPRPNLDPCMKGLLVSFRSTSIADAKADSDTSKTANRAAKLTGYSGVGGWQCGNPELAYTG
jgi:hypothetical protein